VGRHEFRAVLDGSNSTDERGPVEDDNADWFWEINTASTASGRKLNELSQLAES
jgi:hypothetical protein